MSHLAVAAGGLRFVPDRGEGGWRALHPSTRSLRRRSGSPERSRGTRGALSHRANAGLITRPAGAAIIAGVVQTPLSLDTSPDIERRQVESWRQMSPAEKASLVTGLTRAAWEMTFAGVRQRHPDAPPREHFLRVAVIVLGPDLARLAYPDAAGVVSE